MFKVIHVKSKTIPIYGDVVKTVKTGKTFRQYGKLHEETTQEVVHGIKGYSESEIDGEELSKDIESKMNSLVSDGYEIVNIMPITSGKFDYRGGTQNC